MPFASLLHYMALLRNIWRHWAINTPSHLRLISWQLSFITQRCWIVSSPKWFPPGCRETISLWSFSEPYNENFTIFWATLWKTWLPSQSFLWLSLVHHYALSFAPALQVSKFTPFERLVLTGPSQKDLLSDIYKLLNSYSIDTQDKHQYMSGW